MHSTHRSKTSLLGPLLPSQDTIAMNKLLLSLINVYKKNCHQCTSFRPAEYISSDGLRGLSQREGGETFFRLVIPTGVNFRRKNLTMNTVGQHSQDCSVQGANPNLIVKMSVPISKLRVQAPVVSWLWLDRKCPPSCSVLVLVGWREKKKMEKIL